MSQRNGKFKKYELPILAFVATKWLRKCSGYIDEIVANMITLKKHHYANWEFGCEISWLNYQAYIAKKYHIHNFSEFRISPHYIPRQSYFKVRATLIENNYITKVCSHGYKISLKGILELLRNRSRYTINGHHKSQ